MGSETRRPVIATAFETIDEIVRQSGRRETTPLRTQFLQAADKQGVKTPGPLASFVQRQDPQALRLYLLALTKASSKPWETALPAAVWARALNLDLPESKSAVSKISKMWKRIEGRGLIERRRFKRMAHVHLLKEDGSGDPYDLPHNVGDRYFRLPTVFFTDGPSAEERWYLTLNLAEISMLLIARSLGDGFRLPFEDMPAWYGISADTALKGLHGLADHHLIRIDKFYKKAPLAAKGFTLENHYTLLAPFGPVGRRQRRRRQSE